MTSGPDLILGVANAADSVKQREALARLERLSRKADVANAGPAATDTASAWLTQTRAAGGGMTRATSLSAAKSATSAAEKKDVYTQFEALLLQNMVESMMPEDTEALMGSGTAGMVWKSMLAEKIAAEIARSSVIGIAKQVAAGEAAEAAAANPTRFKGKSA